MLNRDLKVTFDLIVFGSYSFLIQDGSVSVYSILNLSSSLFEWICSCCFLSLQYTHFIFFLYIFMTFISLTIDCCCSMSSVRSRDLQ